MTQPISPSEYEKQIADTTLPALVLARQVLSAFRPNPMTDSDWLVFLRAVYVIVREQAWQAAQIARAFFDSERERQLPGIPRKPVDLAALSFERFALDMEPARKIAARPDFSVDQVALRVARSVENGARRTIIRAVEDPDPDLDPVIESQEDEVPEVQDPPPRRDDSRSRRAAQRVDLVKGWARVPTGRETCGFCWMLCSRGPVFHNARTAGAKVSDATAIRKTADGSLTSDDMEQWHTGCDCKVVPVFRLDDWAGKDKADAAWKLWEDQIQGKYKGRDALNAYRRLVEAGEIQKVMGGSRAA